MTGKGHHRHNTQLVEGSGPTRGGLRSKLLRSHLLIAGTWIGVLVVTMGMTLWLGSGMKRLANLHGPTASASTQALNGVHHSLAALRGWIVRADTEARNDRRRAWQEEVFPAIEELANLSEDWTATNDEESQNRLSDIQEVLIKLHESQWWIEEVAHTPGNQPARMRLQEEAQPAADQIKSAISNMIELEQALPANPNRKQLLAVLADLSQFFSHAHARLTDHVESAPATAETDFNRYLGIAHERLDEVQGRAAWLGPHQADLLTWVGTEILAYETVAEQIITLRSQEDWDVAQHLLTTEAIPLASRASELLTAISTSQSEAMHDNATRASFLSHLMLGFGVVVITGISVVAWHISVRSANRITEPIATLSRATRDLAAGRLDEDIAITSSDEIGQLTRSFNAMRASLQDSEESLMIRNVELEQEVADRLRAEQEIKAFAAKLERSNRDLEEFARVASHDLQEPLRKVRAFGDRLNSKYADKIPEGGREYIERMLSATERMQTLINDLLTFSRVSTRANPFERVDLNKLAGEVLSDLELRVQDNNGRVEIGQLPTIDADPTQMRQLFQNLIGNALKYCKPDEPPVVRVLHWPDEDGQRCEITIEDNGIGFEMKHADKIFTVFQRLHGRSEYEGTGVGLAVCRKIVARHGGAIKAESEPGKGSKFFITLPNTQNEPTDHVPQQEQQEEVQSCTV